VPITLEDTLQTVTLPTAAFDLQYDTTVLQFAGFSTPAGTIYQGVSCRCNTHSGRRTGSLASPAINVTTSQPAPLLYVLFNTIATNGGIISSRLLM